MSKAQFFQSKNQWMNNKFKRNKLIQLRKAHAVLINIKDLMSNGKDYL